MVKSNNVKVSIVNNTDIPMTYISEWYECGRLADGFLWPATIDQGHPAIVLNYEVDYGFYAGCSGYVEYKMGSTTVAIAFSNPFPGTNKLGVGSQDGTSVWNDMSNHNYRPFEVLLTIEGKTVRANCSCTGGTVNEAKVEILRG